MINNPTIASVAVERLHDQFDVAINFNPGLNVIYGKNGLGKTTLLHILANVLELDFRRFFHLRFSKIVITTHEKKTLLLERKYDGTSTSLRLLVNGVKSLRIDPGADLPIDEKEYIRAALGARSVYLPAFRSILESAQRGRENYRYAAEVSSTDAFKEVLELEKENRVRDSKRSTMDRYRFERAVDLVAFKTTQCRDWFGQFVPVIRYPSLREVEELLSDEWGNAQLQLARSESQMFSEVFARVFESIVGEEKNLPERGIRMLLDDLSATIDRLDTSGNNSQKVYSRIANAVNKPVGSFSTEEETAKRVLNLYVNFLEERVKAQQSSFEDIRAFEESVNFFLTPKKLQMQSASLHRRPEVRVMSATGRKSYRISSLSSGERQILSMLFCASRMAEDYGIFLIDEPELSLHVDWQRCVLGQLMRQTGDRQVIACTHSPEVGGDHPDDVQWFEPTNSLTYEEEGPDSDEVA